MTPQENPAYFKAVDPDGKVVYLEYINDRSRADSVYKHAELHYPECTIVEITKEEYERLEE